MTAKKAVVTKRAPKKASKPKAPARFKALRSGIVRDALLKLDWGKTLPTEMTHADAQAAVAKLGKGWRLPTVEELFQLPDRTKFSPAIDRKIFPDTKPAFYWSSTPDASAPAFAWGVNFYCGNSGFGHRNLHYWVRPVRASQ